MLSLLENPEILQLIEIAIKEDIGDGDHSSLASIEPGLHRTAICIAKEAGIICGLELARFIAQRIDSHLIIENLCTDGDWVDVGQIVFRINGNPISILSAERLMLNFTQRLSGIATRSYHLAQMLKNTKTQIIDTRKTTPGLRLLEKYAVKVGGCGNHRIGLYDMIMLKDNHIDFAGGIEKAIKKTHAYLKSNGKNLSIEVETRNLEEVKEVIRVGGVQRIMLDNFSPELAAEAVRLINGKFETESSGGITEETIKAYAASGVDFISIGALTHSVKSLDLSLRVK